MATFMGNPNELVRIVPQLRNMRHVRFDEEGKICTDNPKLIARLSKKFEKVELHTCKKCDFSTDNKGLLMAHYREHKKEESA